MAGGTALEYFIIILFFLLAVLILFKRIKRFLRDYYQPLDKNESEACIKASEGKKEKGF